MGIEGLWKIVSPAIEKKSLMELSMNDGFEANRRGDHLYRVGIDASIYMVQAGQPFVHNHARAGANPELRLLFHRLSHFLKFPLHPLFVFDGPDRPNLKRGGVVGKTPHWLSSPFQTMIRCFGFEYHEAPGEAEAELAKLNKLGLIDAVITNDSDALIHGAETIIKIPNIKEDGDKVEVITRARIESMLSLTPDGLLLFALLSGGDYDNGLTGFGPQIAYGLAKTGLGAKLRRALDSADPKAEVNLWLEELRSHLRFDTAGTIGRRYPKLADDIIDGSFPNPSTVELYINPVVSSSFDSDRATEGLYQQPSIQKITNFCNQYFTWKNVEAQLEKFIFDACVLRMLLKPVSEADALRAYFGPESRLKDELDRGLVLSIVEPQALHGVPSFSIKVSTLSFKTAVATASATKPASSSSPRYGTRKVVIPAPILRLSLPLMVQSFDATSHEVIYVDSD